MSKPHLLQELLEKVEQGAWPGSSSSATAPFLFRVLDDVIGDEVPSRLAWDAYFGSINDAEKLHEALLPGWVGGFQTKDGDHHAAHAAIGEPGYSAGSVKKRFDASGPNIGRAWLIAILRVQLWKREGG